MSKLQALHTDFATPAVRYGACNFHLEDPLERIADLLEAPGPRPVVVVAGAAGIGRSYFLDAAAQRVRESGREVLVVDVRLDGFEPLASPGGGVASFLEHLCREREQRTQVSSEALRDLLTEALGPEPEATFAVAIASIVCSLEEHDRIVERALRETEGNSRAKLHALLAALSAEREVLVRVRDAHTASLPLRRWLVDEAAREPRLLVAFTCRHFDATPDVVPGKTNDVPRVDLGPCSRRQIAEFLALRMRPNELPDGLSEALFRVSAGVPGRIGLCLRELMEKDLLTQGEDGTWRLARKGLEDESVAESLSSDLWERISATLHELEEGPELIAFLHLAALCGEVFPVAPILGFLELDAAAAEALQDSVDDNLAEGSFLELLQDSGFDHPSFPGLSVYRFKSPILRAAILDGLGLSAPGGDPRAFAQFLRQRLPLATRGSAGLHLALCEQLGDDNLRKQILWELGYWVGAEEGSVLRDEIARELDEGRLTPETVWSIHQAVMSRWPFQKSLALLDALAARSAQLTPELAAPVANDRAHLLLRLGRLEEAEAEAREAERIHAREHGPSHQDTLLARAALARVLFQRGDLAAARKHLEESLEANRNARGEKDLLSARLMESLASVLVSQKDLAGARELQERSLAVLRELLEPGHPSVLAAQSNLALTLSYQGDFGGSRKLQEPVVEEMRRKHGPGHPETLNATNNLGLTLFSQRDFAAARQLFSQALEAASRSLGADHPTTTGCMANLAAVMHAQRDEAGAVRLLSQALEICRRARGDSHPETARLRQLLTVVKGRSSGT